MVTNKYKIKGMDCDSCAKMIELDLEDAGINCKCSYATENLEIEGTYDFNEVKKIISKAGYTLHT